MELRINFDSDVVENAFEPLDIDPTLPEGFKQQIDWFEKTYNCKYVEEELPQLALPSGYTIGDSWVEFECESEFNLFLLKWSK